MPVPAHWPVRPGLKSSQAEREAFFMENVIIIIGLLALGIVLAILLLKAGFSMPARAVQPEGIADEKPAVDRVPLPEDLPEVVLRFYRAVYGQDQIPTPATVAAFGIGKFRVRKMPFIGYLWAPLNWHMYLRPGQEFSWKMKMSWFRYPVVSGGDGYLGGKGMFKMSKQSLDGEYMDHSEQVMLWIHTLVFSPGSLLAEPSAAWQVKEDGRVRLTLDQSGRSLWFDLTFDADSGLLARIDTERPGSRTGNLYPYSYTLQEQASFNEELSLPDHLLAGWEDDVYNHFVLEGLQYNAPVEDLLARGL
jgi:hypothetical protein